MEDLIATFGPRYNLPIRSFTLEELIRATNNFSEKVYGHDLGDFYKGCLEERPVLVKYFWETKFKVSYFIRDIVIASQMSHHKNVLPLIGCCLELEIPALEYDNALDHEFVAELFNPSTNGNGELLSWRNRIKIAKDICSVLIYLHRAFPSPIIFRDLKVMRVVIDRCGVAKLVGFALSISLPPGELEVEDVLVGTFGYVDPEYVISGFVTEKSDVHNMGVLMLALIADYGDGKTEMAIQDHAKQCIENSRFKQFIDHQIFEEDGQNEHQILQHLLALSSLALRCTEEEGKNRPEIIHVAKQLSQIEKQCARS